MSLEIIGAGFGRTGTLSLKQALETLGFRRCYHMADVLENPGHVALWRAAWRGEDVWDELFAGYRAAVDWPAAAFWPRLAARYPEAKVLLSVREPRSWYRSAAGTIFPRMASSEEPADPLQREHRRMTREIIRDGIFGGDLGDEAHAIEVLEANTARCRAEVPAERLIVFDVGQGWAGLCGPLGLPVPATPFPRLNTTEEFQERWRQRAALAPNIPAVVEEVRTLFERYEQALVDRDVAVLDDTFWHSPYTVRYAMGEHGYGFDAIHAHRVMRPPGPGLKERRIRLEILTLGHDFATVNLEFKVRGQDLVGRQSQTWVRFPDVGWKVVAAHVSTTDGAKLW